MKMRATLALLITTALLTSCAQSGQPGYAPPGEIGMNKTTGGALVGAAAGGLAGSQFGSGSGKLAMTALGVVGGGLLGGSVGASLDRADQQYQQQAAQRAFETAPSGQQVTWRNPDNGHNGYIVPKPAVQQADGSYCREYQQQIYVNGATQQAYGRACRQPDGSWKIVG